MRKVYVGSVYKDIQGEYVQYGKKPSDRQFSEALVGCDAYADEFRFETLEDAKSWFKKQEKNLRPAYIMEGFCTKYYMGTVIEINEYTEDEDGDIEYSGSIDSCESVYVSEELVEDDDF